MYRRMKLEKSSRQIDIFGSFSKVDIWRKYYEAIKLINDQLDTGLIYTSFFTIKTINHIRFLFRGFLRAPAACGTFLIHKRCRYRSRRSFFLHNGQ
jgi:hypothetical protein